MPTSTGRTLSGMALPPALCAHLLLQAAPGRADEVASYLSTLPSVTETAVTRGAYDVIARVDLSTQALSHVLVQARRAPGLSDVRVCTPS